MVRFSARAALALSCALLAAAAAQDGPPSAVTLTVAETFGLRRFGYPVTARVPLPPGAVREAAQTALHAGEQPLRGAQYEAVSRWPDGSVQWLDVSFNLSPGPLEKQDLALRFGPGVSHPSPGAPVVTETPDAVTIRGVYRLPRSGPEFLDRIRYGEREFLRAPARWEAWRRSGRELQSLPMEAAPRTVRIVSGGPVNTVVELSGAFAAAGERFPYRLTMAQPNSKSWFDAVLEVEDPRREILAVTLTVPYLVERDPVLYDFGVGSWLYGTLRAGQAARLEILEKPAWRVLTVAAEPGPAFFPAQPEPRSIYAAASPGQPRAEGWAHLIDGAQGGRAVGFGSPDLAPGGAVRHGAIRVTAAGDASITWWFGSRQPRRVRALYHHVGDPVPVTAATSPTAMLNPLRVTLPRAWYRHCGVGYPGSGG
jgi:hypothetical protein